MVDQIEYNKIVEELQRYQRAIVIAREGLRLVHDQLVARKTVEEIDRILNKDSDIIQ